MSNPLTEHYEADLEQIELHGVSFYVKLPSLTNKRFQRAVMSNVAKRNDQGDFVADDVSIEQMFDAQVDAFVRHCIRKVDGWPDYTPDALMKETPDAAEELFNIAAERVEQFTREAEESVGKSQNGSDGQTDGVENPSNAPSLQSVAL
jgi:hypothetical protein